MGFYATECSEVADLPSKNRVWDFFPSAPLSALPPAPQVTESESVTAPMATNFASGLSFWLSRDPIEEVGGFNLYAAMGNNPLILWDAIGLVFINLTETEAWVKPEKLDEPVKVDPGKQYDGPIDGFSTSLVPGEVYKVADGQDVVLCRSQNTIIVLSRGSSRELGRSGGFVRFVRNLIGPAIIRWFVDGWKDQSWIDEDPKKPKVDWQPLLNKSQE
jgi:hypothetical protein